MSSVEQDYFRAKAVAAVLRAVYKLQPEDATAVLKEALASYRTFDEIYAAEAAAKPKAAARPVDDGNFG